MRLKNEYIKAIFFLLIFSTSLFLYTGCSGKSALVNVKWTQDGSSKSLEWTAKATSSVPQEYNDYYNSIGSLVEFGEKNGLTPSEFKLPIFFLGLSNDSFSVEVSNDMTPDPEKLHADFTSSYSSSAVREVEIGEYDTFIAFFETIDSMHGMTDGEVQLTCSIQVTIPGYTDSELPDITEEAFPSEVPTDEELFLDLGNRGYRKYLGNNVFEFDFGRLQPVLIGQIAEFGHSDLPLNSFIFQPRSDTAITITGVNYDSATLDVADYCNNTIYGSGGAAALVQAPMDAIYIDGDTEINVVFNLDEIIKVYDNSTPEDKTDDIVVLEYKFWERMSVEAHSIE